MLFILKNNLKNKLYILLYTYPKTDFNHSITPLLYLNSPRNTAIRTISKTN